MIIYIVKELDGTTEGGEVYESIVGAYIEKQNAEAFVRSQNGGRMMAWHINETELKDAHLLQFSSLP